MVFVLHFLMLKMVFDSPNVFAISIAYMLRFHPQTKSAPEPDAFNSIR